LKTYHLLEKAFNAYLELDPNYVNLLEACQGKTIQIQLMDFSLQFFLSFTNDRIFVTANSINPPDTIIKANSLTFLNAYLLDHANRLSDIEILGDTELGYEMYGFIKNMQIDWEMILSNSVGDILAYQISSRVRNLFTNLKELKHHTYENLSEYLIEEKNCFPTKKNIEAFNDEVDSITKRVNRMEAYLKKTCETI
jgi:ubiquinone biosynthesis protein UbiJ